MGRGGVFLSMGLSLLTSGQDRGTGPTLSLRVSGKIFLVFPDFERRTRLAAPANHHRFCGMRV